MTAILFCPAMTVDRCSVVRRDEDVSLRFAHSGVAMTAPGFTLSVEQAKELRAALNSALADNPRDSALDLHRDGSVNLAAIVKSGEALPW